mgnify:CR=1 FL=1
MRGASPRSGGTPASAAAATPSHGATTQRSVSSSASVLTGGSRPASCRLPVTLTRTGATAAQGTAYVNNAANNGGITTQYTVDETSDSLYIQNPPGVITPQQPGVRPPRQRVLLCGAAVFGLLSGVIPAWKMSRLNPVQALKET